MEYNYNFALVALSFFLAILSSFIALATASRIRQHEKTRLLWIFGGGVSLGLGVWVMHFVGMLAYHLPIIIAYDVFFTVVSIVLAITASIIALFIITSNNQLTFASNLISAFLMGSGIAAMHYTGIYAMEMFPDLQFNPILFATSLLIAYVASYYAIKVGFAASNKLSILTYDNFISAVIMGVAIAGMHYTAMEAQIIESGTICLAVDDGITEGNISILVVVGVFFILVLNALFLGYDLRIAEMKGERANLLAKKRKQTLEVARKVAETLAVQYRESEEFNKKLFDTVANVVLVIDHEGYIVRINRAAENITGYLESELTGRRIWDVLVAEDEREYIKKLFESLIEGQYPNRQQIHIITAHGDRRTIEWLYTALSDEDNELDYVIATGVDITDQQLYEEQLRLAAVSFETNEAICITDTDGKILRVNAAFTEITGYTEEESFGKTPGMLKSGRHDDEFYRQMWQQITNSGYWTGEIWNKRKNGEVYPEWLRITAVYDDEDKLTNFVATFSDISDIKQAEEEIHFYSNFDTATKLPNKKLFTELMDKELDVSKLSEKRGALLYLELMQLDKLTDNIGLGAVDSYIANLAGQLHAEYGNDLIIGRINNTDLAVLLDDIAPQNVISQSREAAEHILNRVKQGMYIEGQMAYIQANIGIVDFPQEEEMTDELMQYAITAANRARRLKPGSYQFYSSYMQRVAIENYHLEVALREAVVNDQFDLLLQPQVDIENNLIGAEALIRWSHEGEMVSPAKFIPLAEESDLIIAIGNWVLSRAMDYIKLLQASDMPQSFRTLSVNVSAIQLQQENFISNLKQLLIEKGIDPSYLKLEITETAVLERPEVAIHKIEALKEIGISIALDDFGTGYSSLSYLQKMQLDQLKIDRTFVTDLSINKTSQALTETIIVMAKNLGMQVIAEGVETRSEQALLAEYGCTQYQGFYYSRPIELDAFLDYAHHPIQTPD